jgi:hypothetical protein
MFHVGFLKVSKRYSREKYSTWVYIFWSGVKQQMFASCQNVYAIFIFHNVSLICWTPLFFLYYLTIFGNYVLRVFCLVRNKVQHICLDGIWTTWFIGRKCIVTGENRKPSYGGDDEAFLHKVINTSFSCYWKGMFFLNRSWKSFYFILILQENAFSMAWFLLRKIL